MNIRMIERDPNFVLLRGFALGINFPNGKLASLANSGRRHLRVMQLVSERVSQPFTSLLGPIDSRTR